MTREGADLEYSTHESGDRPEMNTLRYCGGQSVAFRLTLSVSLSVDS